MKLVKGMVTTLFSIIFMTANIANAANTVTGDYNGDGNQDSFNQADNKGGSSSLTANAGGTIANFHISWTGAHPDISEIEDWSAHSYGAFSANLNSSPGDELLLLGKKEIILLHGDIITPILIPKDVQNAIVSWSSSGVATYTSFDLDADPDQFNVLFGDFDGDGYQEFVLQAKSSGSTSYIMNSDGSISETLSNGYLGVDWSASSFTLSVEDLNNDGIDDLKAVSKINGQDDRYYYLKDNAVDYYDLNYGSSPTAGFSPGVTAGQFRVNEHGAATYAIGLNLPEGTAGVTPEISLGYSSQGGDGVMGIGWALSAGSAITRCSKTFAQDGVITGITNTSEDRFCLNGQRLINTSGTHGTGGAIYYTESDSFVKVEAHGNATETGPLGFTVETKAGEIHYYGYVDSVVGDRSISLVNYWGSSDIGQDAFIEPEGKSSKSLAQNYLLKAIKDVADNYILFEYDEQNGNATIQRVSYTGNSRKNKRPYAYVNMNYSTKATMAKRSGFVVGSAVLQDKLLDSINVVIDDQIVHHYALEYDVPTLAEENYTLTSIQECIDSNKTDCYPATSFEWLKPVPSTQTTQEFCEYEPNIQPICYDITTSSDFNPFGNQSDKLISAYNEGTNQVIDMNGDGYSDIVYTQSGYYKVAFGPKFTEAKNLTTIGDHNSQYLLTLDYNGDGKRDLLVANNDSSFWHIVSFENFTSEVEFCETEGNFCENVLVEQSLKVESIGRHAYGLEGKAQIMDIDGNGLEDIVYQNGSKIYWYANNGGTFSGAAELISFATSSTIGALNTSMEKHTANMKNAAGIDVNGDGRSDLIVKITDTTNTCMLNGQNYPANTQGECEVDIGGTWSTSSSTQYKLYISNGSSLVFEQSLGNHEDVRVADLNGDGLTDLLEYDTNNTWSYRLSNGKELLDSKLLPNGSTTDTYKNQSFFIDLNGDGAVEFLRATTSTNWNIYVSQYASKDSISLIHRGNIVKKSGAVYQFGDVDGDGKLDLLQGKSGTHGWKVSYAPRSGKPDYIINKFITGFGGSTEVSYRPMTDLNVYQFTGSTEDVGTSTFSPMYGISLVSNVETQTSNTDSVGIDYQYGGYLINREGRGLLGFREVRTIDKQTSIKTETVYSQTFPFIGMPETTNQYLSDGRLVGEAVNILDSKVTANGQTFPYIKSSTEKSWSIGSDAIIYQTSKNESSFTYDSYGNLLNSTITSSDHSDNDALTTTVVNTYGNLDEKINGRLKDTVVTKTRDGNSLSRKTEFTYYPQSDSNSPFMLKTTKLFPDNTSKYLLTSYDYDDFGNKTIVTKTAFENSDGTNLQNRTAESFYDNRGRLIDHTISSAGIETSYKYNGVSANSVSGLVHSVTTTVNGISQTTTVDNWGRTISRTSPGGSTEYTYYDFCSLVSCDSSGGHYRIRTTMEGAPEKRIYFDQFSREIESRSKSFSGGWNIVRRTYDSQGRSDKLYEPTTAASTTFFSQPTYDLYGRVIQAQRPDSTIVHSEFYGLKTKSIDAKGNPKYSWKNVQGELAKAEDALGNTLEYTYDPYGNLLNVLLTNSSGETSTQVVNIYDSFGHKIQTNDKDKGIWTYQYNGFGELVSQTTARNQTSSLDYDVAGRLLRRYESEGTSCWNYNATTGRLDNELVFENVNKTIAQCGTATDYTYKKSYQYDSYGRVNQTDVTLANVNSNVDGVYSTTTGFDEFGRVREVIYPNNLSIENEFQNGYLKRITNPDLLDSSGNPRIYQDIISMNAYGQVTNVNYANGASEVMGYRNSDGRVLSHTLNKSGNKHLLSYLYDVNGNLDYRRHQFFDKGFTDWDETLTYDELNRLDYRTTNIRDNSYLTAGFKANHDYAYDDWGNLTGKSQTGNYVYGISDKKNRLTAINSSAGFPTSKTYSFGYDANGNITSDGSGRVFTYFSFDKVDRITKGSIYSEFKYAANRGRYYKYDKRTEDSVTANYYTAYVGAYEKIHRTGGGKSALTEHKVNLGNIVITDRSDGTDAENYLHKDHLGSTISVTDKSGNVVQQFTYDPWGKQTKIYQEQSFIDYVFNQPTNRGYTGHEEIRDLDIVHMNGRIYDANIARFMQADPIIQSPSNFQNFNRYSYVLNRPLAMTDPSGYSFKSLYKSAMKADGRWAIQKFSIKNPNLHAAGMIIINNFVPWGQFIAAGISFDRSFVQTGSLRQSAYSGVTSLVISYAGQQGGVLGAAFAGGIMADLQGGKFAHGFWAAGIGYALGGDVSDNPYVNVVVSAIVGGTVSKVSGGKFANGAKNAAFASALQQDWTAMEPTVEEALLYLDESSQFREIKKQADDLNITIRVTDGRTWFDHKTNTIFWNPSTGLKSDFGIMSPALALAHEFTHAVEFHRVGFKTFEESLDRPIETQYMHMSDGSVKVIFNAGISPEEARATQVETIIANQLGEPIRSNYNAADSISVPSVTFNCHIGDTGC